MSRRRAKKKVALVNAPVKPPPQKQESDVSADRVLLYLRSRFNPIRRLTPELLSAYLDRSKVGFLREIALVWDSIEDRDNKIKLAMGLRKKSVARFDYQIEVMPDLEGADKKTAEEHKAALEYFYGNLRTTRAIDENERGGVKLLVRQMMDCVGAKYSVHEIVWMPQADGGLTAEFRWSPLWFFENLSGKLRYLTREGETYGVDLEEGGWMITTGEGLMYALSILYMFKTLPLRDWVTFSERNGMPAFIGKTPAAPGTEQWDALEAAVQAMATDFAAVMNTVDTIEAVDLKGGGELPYPPLVEWAERAIVSLVRGGDLSTMSSGKQTQGHGSQRQDDEADALLDDDVEMINETLHQWVDKYVIEYLFNDDRPLARFKLVVPPDKATAQDLAIDQFLVSAAPTNPDGSPGVGLSWADALERYGRKAAKPGEPMLQAPQQDEQIPNNLGNTRLFNSLTGSTPHDAPIEKMMAGLIKTLSASQLVAFQPLGARIDQIIALPEETFANEIEALVKELPTYVRKIMDDPTQQRIWENTLSAVLLNGLTSIGKQP